ncbi:hypothetical protein KGO95_02345 [Patescibacteria group bacterium]|nr:hypothetical protein [Patescibacteria group bacterium]
MEENKKISLYLAGSIKLWRKEFTERYSAFFNRTLDLFEPGTLGVPDDHTKIAPGVAFYDVDRIKNCDAVLAFMKEYVPDKNGGPAGTDSSWECGYAFGLGRPTIAIVEDLEHLAYFEKQWMLTYTLSAFLTSSQEVVDRLKGLKRFQKTDLIFYSDSQSIEKEIRAYLENKLSDR